MRLWPKEPVCSRWDEGYCYEKAHSRPEVHFTRAHLAAMAEFMARIQKVNAVLGPLKEERGKNQKPEEPEINFLNISGSCAESHSSRSLGVSTFHFILICKHWQLPPVHAVVFPSFSTFLSTSALWWSEGTQLAGSWCLQRAISSLSGVLHRRQNWQKARKALSASQQSKYLRGTITSHKIWAHRSTLIAPRDDVWKSKVVTHCP